MVCSPCLLAVELLACVSASNILSFFSQVVQNFYSEFTGQSIEKMEEETDRDTYMSPQQAIDLGLIDAII